MKQPKIYTLFITLTLLFFSCRKDTPPTLPQSTVTGGKRLIICNEGGFGYNNAGISVYDPVSNATTINAYASANTNPSLGDVLQSLTIYNDKYYFVVNNSGKIVVCDKNFVRLTTISGFLSPRYMQVVSANKAYISNYLLPTNPNQTNYIQVLDVATNVITKTIRLDGWPEQMVLSYGKVYITNQNKKYVYVIDSSTDQMDSIYVGSPSLGIVKDANEKLWISCDADASINTSARLVEIDPLTNKLQDSVSLNTTQNSISRLSINGNGTSLYYLMNDAYKMDIATHAITNIIQQGTHTFYGLCIDPNDETIYISDAGNYNSNGKLLRYRSNFSATGTYTVGLIPGYMLMD